MRRREFIGLVGGGTILAGDAELRARAAYKKTSDRVPSADDVSRVCGSG